MARAAVIFHVGRIDVLSASMLDWLQLGKMYARARPARGASAASVLR